MPGDGNFYLHVFRVEEGLGNAILAIFPDGRRAIVDWGTQAPSKISRVLELAPSGFSFIAATHPHEDHVLGIERLLDACASLGRPVDFFVCSATAHNRSDSPLTRAIRRAGELGILVFDAGVRWYPRTRWRPEILAHDDAETWSVQVLAPPSPVVGAAEIKAVDRGNVAGNETSLVLLFRFNSSENSSGRGRAILPGDATPATLQLARDEARRAGLDLDNQALLVPHHGSSKNLPSWLVDLTHGIAVISGRPNSRYHPSRETLRVLSERCRIGTGSRLYCTSYAKACGDEFGARAMSAEEGGWIRPGPCFGDVTIRVPPASPAEVIGFSERGDLRRRFGHCGNG